MVAAARFVSLALWGALLALSSCSRESDGGAQEAVAAVGGLTPEGERLFRESRGVSPDPFGGTLAALAALPPETARLALLLGKIHGDEEVVLWVARSWAITKRDLRGDPARIEPFLQVVESKQPGRTIEKRDAARLGACLYVLHKVILSGEEGYAGQMGRIERAAIDLSAEESLRESAGLTLFLLKERAWLGPEGERALESVYETNPNFRARFANGHGALIAEFEANTKG